jgi:hypothetical protein
MDNPAPANVSSDASDERKEFEIMVNGGMYLASDPYIQKIAKQESAKVKAINAEEDDAKKIRLLRDFMGLSDDVDFYWITPLFAEYVRFYEIDRPYSSKSLRPHCTAGL